ncbi:MAG TPA: diacylglycerol kinase family protein [Candidatus Limnocylindria bacterium]
MTVATRTRALLIVNPNAGKRHARAEDLDTARRILESAGIALDVVECAETGPTVEECARRALSERYDAVIVAGGDGTLQAVAREVLDTDVAVGILPFGSFMNIAKGLGIPMDPLEAARIIARGHVRRADVGEVNGHVFFEAAGIGLDAQMFGAARAVERRRWRRAWRRMADWATHGTHRIVVEGERDQVTYRAMQVLVLNSPYYAWSFPVVGGSMHDGLLEIAIFPRMGRRDLIRSLVRLWREGQHEAPPIVLREREVRIRSDAPLAVHADGAAAGTLPATFRCRAGALAVYVPEAKAA